MYTDDLHLTSFNSFDQVLSNVDSTTINETSKKLIIMKHVLFEHIRKNLVKLMNSDNTGNR